MLVCLAAWCFAVNSIDAAEGAAIRLFEIENAEAFPDAKVPKGSKQLGMVRLNPKALEWLKQQAMAPSEKPGVAPFECLMALSGEKRLLVSVSSVYPVGEERFSLVGKPVGDPLGLVVLAYYEGELSIDINRSNGKRYQLGQIQDSIYRVSEALPDRRIRCGVDGDFEALQRKVLGAQQPRRRVQKQSKPSSGEAVGAGHKLLGSPATSAKPVTVDIMVVYTKEARKEAGSTKKMKLKIDKCITTANAIFENSEVHVKCNLAHTVETGYTHGNDLSDDLERLSGEWDGDMDSIHKLRTNHGADLVSLFVTNDKDTTVAGVAWRPHTKDRFKSGSGFSVNQSDYWDLSNTFTHEIGHNFGCHHDRETIDDNNGEENAIHNYSWFFDVFSGIEGLKRGAGGVRVCIDEPRKDIS